jgi:hypothetical protein
MIRKIGLAVNNLNLSLIIMVQINQNDKQIQTTKINTPPSIPYYLMRVLNTTNEARYILQNSQSITV